MNFSELMEKCENITIIDSFAVAEQKIPRKQNIVCSISGGSDSDIMLDIITKVDRENKVLYVFLIRA